MKLPRTQHIEGSRMPPGQSDPEAVPFSDLASKTLVVEEKVDGAGVSLSFDDSLNLIVNHRGSPAVGKEFAKLISWADYNFDGLYTVLSTRYIMFGEWMYKKHTIFYNELPDYFLESDMYDKEKGIWLTSEDRSILLSDIGVHSVPYVAPQIYSSLEEMLQELTRSDFISSLADARFRLVCKRLKVSLEEEEKITDLSGLMEGLYIKHEEDGQVKGRYKYVRYEFLQKILESGTHVQDRKIIPNQLTKDSW